MLKTYINTIPYTKFILITDSLENRDQRLLEHILQGHLNKNQHKVHYCVFEGVFKRVQDKFHEHSNIKLYNFVCDSQDKEETVDVLEQVVLGLGARDVIFVDSLANAIFRYGLAKIYRIFNMLKNNKALQQIVSVLHKDLVQGDCNRVIEYFSNLSTLSINVQPKFLTDARRIKYEYKKTGGRVISEIEEYAFEGQHLLTSKIAKPDPDKILKSTAPQEINPEELSTFRIGLTDEEKLSRDKVILPYLPDANKDKAEGKIFYKLDELDDWDEEDPDDDLDI